MNGPEHEGARLRRTFLVTSEIVLHLEWPPAIHLCLSQHSQRCTCLAARDAASALDADVCLRWVPYCAQSSVENDRHAAHEVLQEYKTRPALA